MHAVAQDVAFDVSFPYIPVLVPIQVSEVSLPIQPPASAPGKQWWLAQMLGFPVTHIGDGTIFLAPS